jgi:hypothetical protein
VFCSAAYPDLKYSNPAATKDPGKLRKFLTFKLSLRKEEILFVAPNIEKRYAFFLSISFKIPTGMNGSWQFVIGKRSKQLFERDKKWLKKKKN